MDLHSCETRVPGNASYMRKAFNNVNDFIVAQRARLAEAATRNGNRNVVPPALWLQPWAFAVRHG
jgi:hypothetical protein